MIKWNKEKVHVSLRWDLILDVILILLLLESPEVSLVAAARAWPEAC